MKPLNAPTPAGERIRLARLQRGLSQENMADLLNLSTTAYGDIERGKTELTLSRLGQIAQVLGTSVVALISDEPVALEPTVLAPNEVEQLRNTVEKQEVEIEKLRLEVDHYKRRYDERLALELLRAVTSQQPERERIGF
ncbi:transcriptional regulator, XRE family [Fibrella aestuarina BUZ 2]|uniref:Transcriptional regulator, XRE family n=1 Tax=Fibrella aestuarina BUZ 2 TaxID=1166018 RepID=I0KDG5_9BACT|nr:helix-turn-helix transcriptional regulator [Fibrella aestuarina]CCH02168.1 transcriptional regulator, XRE family [Fibrella aestuarina BUZ 2]